MNTNDSSADEFRLVDLFSPSETDFVPPASGNAGVGPSVPQPQRMSGELPDSFLFANPFFAPDRRPEAK
ncbi:MAG: hypothetical protein C0518_10515 [Opitutus sp.]|nr:hypothetical protein [Opitutus sp.]